MLFRVAILAAAVFTAASGLSVSGAAAQSGGARYTPERGEEYYDEGRGRWVPRSEYGRRRGDDDRRGGGRRDDDRRYDDRRYDGRRGGGGFRVEIVPPRFVDPGYGRRRGYEPAYGPRCRWVDAEDRYGNVYRRKICE